MEIAERLAKDYYHDDSIDKVNFVRRMLAIPGIYNYLSPDEVLWVYMLLSDEGLALLKTKTKKEDFTSSLSEELLRYPGHHIYIFRSLAPSNGSQRAAFRRAATFLLQKHQATDISWHDNERVYLHTYRGE